MVGLNWLDVIYVSFIPVDTIPITFVLAEVLKYLLLSKRERITFQNFFLLTSNSGTSPFYPFPVFPVNNGLYITSGCKGCYSPFRVIVSDTPDISFERLCAQSFTLLLETDAVLVVLAQRSRLSSFPVVEDLHLARFSEAFPIKVLLNTETPPSVHIVYWLDPEMNSFAVMSAAHLKFSRLF